MNTCNCTNRWMGMLGLTGAIYLCLAAAGCVETTRGTAIISSDPPAAFDREAGYSTLPPREPWQY